MAFKGAEIVKSLCLRRLAMEEICDIICKNAEYIHFVRTIELPYLKHFWTMIFKKRGQSSKHSIKQTQKCHC